MSKAREAKFARIFAAEYADAVVTGEVGNKKDGYSLDTAKRKIAIKRLAAVCHDRRIIAKVSGVRLANVKMWLGDETSSWPKESEKGCR